MRFDHNCPSCGVSFGEQLAIEAANDESPNSIGVWVGKESATRIRAMMPGEGK